MKTLTEAEAFALDEYYTQNPPKVDQSKARIRIPLTNIDNLNTASVSSISMGEQVQERAAATVS